MRRTSVNSSNIAAIGYGLATFTLEVEFMNGSIYQYFNVPQYLYHQLMNASSKGQFLNDYIKYSFRYQRIV